MKSRAGISAVLACSAFLALQAPIAAKTIFDGNWSVTAQTTGGSCDRYLGYRLTIIDGRVRSRDATGASGRVTPSGDVSVTLRGRDSIVNGVGRLAASSGRGRWAARSPSGRCSGAWRAWRRP
jgi:hypothetical protein